MTILIVLAITILIIVAFIPYIAYLIYKIKKHTKYIDALEKDIKNSLQEENIKLVQHQEELQDVLNREKTALEMLKQQCHVERESLQQTKDTTDLLRQQAQERAEEEYKLRIENLQNDYRHYQEQLDSELSIAIDAAEAQKGNLQKEIEEIISQQQSEQQQLEGLRAKRHAYIEAQKRAKEIEDKKDYYRPVILREDIDDISLLRDLQKRMANKDVIDKVIWEVYYRPAYNSLCDRIISSKEKICGVYKITNTLDNMSYIGQSVDIKERIRQHLKSALAHGKPSNKLYQAMQKNGPENFTFEILEEIERYKLNEREKYWIDFYQTKEQLNSTIGGA